MPQILSFEHNALSTEHRIYDFFFFNVMVSPSLLPKYCLLMAENLEHWKIFNWMREPEFTNRPPMLPNTDLPHGITFLHHCVSQDTALLKIDGLGRPRIRRVYWHHFFANSAPSLCVSVSPLGVSHHGMFQRFSVFLYLLRGSVISAYFSWKAHMMVCAF